MGWQTLLRFSVLVLCVLIFAISGLKEPQTNAGATDDTSFSVGVDTSGERLIITPPRSEAGHRRLHDMESLTITLTDGTEKTFHHVRYTEPRNGRFLGESPEGDTLHLLQDDSFEDVVIGSLVLVEESMVYQVRRDATGKVHVIGVHSSDFRPEAMDYMREESHHRSLSDHRNSSSLPQRRLEDANASPTIDVMVLWTKKAECQNSMLHESCSPTAMTKANMENVIALAISETNTAFSASGVNAQLRLVHSYREESFVESSSSQALYALYSPLDGQVDEVHVKREAFGADAVVLMYSDKEYCGRGYYGYPVARPTAMFSVVAWDCATGYFTFGHELGHNMVRTRPILNLC